MQELQKVIGGEELRKDINSPLLTLPNGPLQILSQYQCRNGPEDSLVKLKQSLKSLAVLLIYDDENRCLPSIKQKKSLRDR
jgi:hypothetical protein